MDANLTKITKEEFFAQGKEDGKGNRHIEDLCQCFWSDFVGFCDRGAFRFELLVEAFPAYRKGIEFSRELNTI